jgi:hypothetical protein
MFKYHPQPLPPEPESVWFLFSKDLISCCISPDIVHTTFNVFTRSMAFQLLNGIISISRTYYIMRMTLFCASKGE